MPSPRCLDPEIMDRRSLSTVEARAVLRDLEWINRRLGGHRATLHHLSVFSKRWLKGHTIRMVDWGTGGADLPRAIVRWARRHRHHVEVVGIEQDATLSEQAKSACRDYPEIRIIQADARRYHVSPGRFDYALSSLVLHHLSDADIVDLLRKSAALARRGLIMNDLRRSWRAWTWAKVLGGLCRWHPIVRQDGALSVRRAFTAEELHRLAEQASLPFLRVYAHFGHRWTLAGEKP